MNFIYVTDLHLSDRQPINRVTPVVESGLYKLEWVLKKAYETQSILLIGGDFFHSPCPSMDLLNKIISLFIKYPVTAYMVLGNHDTYGNTEQLDDTAIQILFNTGLIKQLTNRQPLELGNFVFMAIPYYKRTDEEKEFNKINGYPFNFGAFARAYKSKKKVLIAHMPFVTKPAMYEHILLSDIKTDANLVLCGHIHQPFRVKIGSTVFYNPGCFIRRAKNEKDQEVKYLFFSDTEFKEGVVPVPVPEFNSVDVEEAAAITVLEEKIEIPDLEAKILASDQPQDVKDRCLLLLKNAQAKFNEKS